MVSTPYPSTVYFVPLELNIKFTSSNSTFLIQHLNAAALYAEGGEECGEYAHDKLEHGLEGFFV